MDDLQQIAYEAKIKVLESELSRIQTAYMDECEVDYWKARSDRRGKWLERYLDGERFDIPAIARIMAEVQGMVDGEFVKIGPEGR